MTTTFDFGYGPVPAHQHSNGGGWVADTATVADTACVDPYAKVFGNAWVFGNALVFGNARVFGNALVAGNAKIESSAHVKMISRSDNYTFTLFKCEDNIWKLTAGCRYFTIKEAEKHWLATRDCTRLGGETMDILDLFKKHIIRYS